jgi:hypothetical protein
MSSRKNAVVTGSIFFVLRLLFCALVVVHLNRSDANGFEIDWTGTICAIAFGIGAFTDLFLIFGAWKKNSCAIYVWCIAQIFFLVGGIPCCIAIPLVAMKAVQEIEDEE